MKRTVYVAPGLHCANCARHLYGLDGKRLDLEIDTGDVRAAIGRMIVRTLAKLCEADMTGPAQLQPCRDHHRVDFYAGTAFELKQHVNGAGVICTAAKHPSAAAQNRTGE